jgi:L-malate glycosyltransferase
VTVENAPLGRRFAREKEPRASVIGRTTSTGRGTSPPAVLLLAREMGPGGSERQLAELARKLDPSRFAVHVGFVREGIRSKELREAGVRCFRIGVQSFLRPHALAGAVKLARYIKDHRIQVAHAFDYPLACFGVPIARACGVPVVLSSQRSDRSLIPKTYLRVIRWTDRLANGIVVNCEAMQRHLLYEEHIQASKIRLCPNGIDTGTFSPGAKLPLFGATDSGTVVAGCVAVLRPEKNLSLLVRAFSLAAKRHKNLKLLLVGSGPEEDSLRELISRLNLGGNCLFVPTQAQTAHWLRSIDIFVLPSLLEALSNSLMEAMACGCAAIASNIGGNPELIRPGQTGLLFESGDAEDLAEKLGLLAENATARNELSRKGSAFIRENFSLKSAATRMETIYEEMLLG